MNSEKLEQVKAFIQNEFEGGIQMFNTRNFVGDYMETIYDSNGVTIDYAPQYHYIEVFGLSKEEFEQLQSEVYNEANNNDKGLEDLFLEFD